MTQVFRGAMLLVGGVALFLLGWYIGTQVQFPSVQELSGIDRKSTFERDEYTVRYPIDWKVVELQTGEQTDLSVPLPSHHVAFNRQQSVDGATTNDCTLEIRTYTEAASPSLEEWAKKVLGVVNPAFGGEVTFETTKIGGEQGVQSQGGQDIFVGKSGKVFYLIVGTKIAESASGDVGDTCKDSVNSMLRSFDLK